MADPVRLSIFLTGDEHGHIHNAPAIQRTVDAARQDNPEGTLLVSSGDVFQGSATSQLLGPQPSQELLRAAGYQAVAIGNHDFDRGVPFLRKWIHEAGCPVLNANVTDSSTHGLMAETRPYQVFMLNGVRVGLIGVTTPDAPTMGFAQDFEGVEFGDPVEAVRTRAEDLRRQGVHVIVALSHLGLPADRALAAAVPGLTAILGGHTHDALTQAEVVNGTSIVHSGAFRGSVARLDLMVDPDSSKVVDVAHQLIPARQEGPADGPVGAIVARYEEQMNVELKQPVGRIPKMLRHDDVERDDLGAVITDAMCRIGGADIALINNKFARTDLPQGEVTRGDLLTAMPFDNRVRTIDMPVAEVERMVADSLRRCDESSLEMGGKYSPYSSLKDGKVHLTTEDGVSAKGTVRVATTDFIASGGLGYFLSDMRAQTRDFGLVRDAVAAALSAGG